MGHTKGEWKLTDGETACVLETGDEGDVIRAQDAKKKAYIANGGIILDPDALEDLYEASKGALADLDSIDELCRIGGVHPYIRMREDLEKALAKAEGK